MKMLFAALVLTLVAAPALAQADHSGHAPAKPAAKAATTAIANGVGVVRAVNAKKGSVTLDHEPMPARGWPAMTMTFKAAPALLQGVAAGQKVDFQLQGQTVVALKARKPTS